MGKQYQLYEIVKKFTGEIMPVGETNEDNKRFGNLQRTQDLVTALVIDIDTVAYENKDRSEYSMKRASDEASKFLTKDLGISE
jgi:hypothetical protein